MTSVDVKLSTTDNVHDSQVLTCSLSVPWPVTPDVFCSLSRNDRPDPLGTTRTQNMNPIRRGMGIKMNSLKPTDFDNKLLYLQEILKLSK